MIISSMRIHFVIEMSELAAELFNKGRKLTSGKSFRLNIYEKEPKWILIMFRTKMNINHV